jgi:hypothetical protein
LLGEDGGSTFASGGNLFGEGGGIILGSERGGKEEGLDDRSRLTISYLSFY